MPFSAKSTAPHVTDATVPQLVWDRTLNSRLTLFVAPPGYLLMEGLASILNERGWPAVWLRLEEADRDPAMFLLSLIDSVRRVNPACGAKTLAEMRRSPGPTSGWPALYTALGQELADALPTPCAIVLECLDALGERSQILPLLTSHLVPELPPSISLVLTAQKAPARNALPEYTIIRGVRDVYVDPSAAERWGHNLVVGLASNLWQRIAELTDGRAEVLFTLSNATRSLGPDLIQQIVKRAGRHDDLLRRVASAWYSLLDPPAQKSFALATRIEYVHANALEGSLHSPTITDYPCLQPLDDGWFHTRDVWRAPIRAIIPHSVETDRAGLREAADDLAKADAVDRALQIYLSIDDYDSAAKVVGAATDKLMALGAWSSLSTWIADLPVATLKCTPWLLYTRGEIAAVLGSAYEACRAFSEAADEFMARQDPEGACQSLLAESALAAWDNDLAYAEERALLARSTAKASTLTWYTGWANWQLACLAAEVGSVDEGLGYLAQAASTCDESADPFMAELLKVTKQLMLSQRELRLRREMYRQAYFALEHAEQELAEKLHNLLRLPPLNHEFLLETRGWLRTPMSVKLSAPQLVPLPTTERPEGFWSTVLGALGLRRRPNEASVDLERNSQPALSGLQELPALPMSEPLLLPTGAVMEKTTLEENARAKQEGDASVLELWPPKIPSETDPQTDVTLSVHLLGSFVASVDDMPITKWRSQRGQAVFKYLLAHRQTTTPRELLVDLFWPHADAHAGRNNLNVALHGLRKDLSTATDVAIVIFESGGYRISSDLKIWLDVEEFERHVEAGQSLERVGVIELARAEYEAAISVYNGDYLADDMYEEWPIVDRVRLRSTYLDTLDTLSQMYFGRGDYGESVRLCKLMLSRDGCREDAHRRLMLCYSRLGQQRLAVQQYQTCVEILRAELDVEPEPATISLYGQIRASRLA